MTRSSAVPRRPAYSRIAGMLARVTEELSGPLSINRVVEHAGRKIRQQVPLVAISTAGAALQSRSNYRNDTAAPVRCIGGSFGRFLNKQLQRLRCLASYPQ